MERLGTKSGGRVEPAKDIVPAAGSTRGDLRPQLEPLLHTVTSRPARSAAEASARLSIGRLLTKPVTAGQIRACATGLLKAGQPEDAEQLFLALTRIFSADPANHAGLGCARVRRGFWNEALASLEMAAALSPEAHAPGLIADHVTALMNLGRPADALRILETRGREMLMYPYIARRRIDCLLALHLIQEARNVFAEALPLCTQLDGVKQLFELVPRLFDGFARHQNYLMLLGELNKMESGVSSEQSAAAIALRLRILLALRNYDAYVQIFGRVNNPHEALAGMPDLVAVAAKLRHGQFPDYTQPKIFGIGLSRTGTTSLCTALRTLGFSALHWSNHLTGEIFAECDVPLFDAFVDTPACVDFEKNYYLLPKSKFIYTTRQRDDWERSWTAYTTKYWGLTDHRSITEQMRRRDYFADGQRFVDIQMSLYYKFSNYLEAYQAYDRRVRLFFSDKPRERFLEFNMFAGDGWHKLCGFLARDLPTGRFPWENRG
jgi:tetratricopeptide (TPR) repeat protein